MTQPERDTSCDYAGIDNTAVVGSTVVDGTPGWFSRCNCGELTCEIGTYEEACDALTDHRPRKSEEDNA